MKPSQPETILQAYNWLASGHYMRTLHFHNTPLQNKDNYRAILKKVSEHYDTLSLEDIHNRLNGSTTKRTPLVIGLFDGYRNNYDAFYPLLEEYGLTAWFLLVTDFINTPVAKQYDMLDPYKMQWLENEYADGRYAMTWSEAAKVAKTQTIVNHSSTHFLLNESHAKEPLLYEVESSQGLIEEKLSISPRTFCWLGGGRFGLNDNAAELLLANKFEYIFGERLECIQSINCPNQRPAQLHEISRDDTCNAALQLEQYEAVFTKITIFDGVPALLPFYAIAGDAIDEYTPQNMQLAARFVCIAQFLMQNKGYSEPNACQKARDIIALNDFIKKVPVTF